MRSSGSYGQRNSLQLRSPPTFQTSHDRQSPNTWASCVMPGLVTERRDGVRRLYSANQAEMTKVREFLDSFWSESLLRLRDLAESAESPKEKP